jgi:hypothetical protein
MPTLLAIDPGTTHSGWVLIDIDTCRPIRFDKTNNETLEARIWADPNLRCDRAVIEMIASYGMAVGAEVFDTCVWIGRYWSALNRVDAEPELMKRHPVKLHHCHTARATDSNIRQALVDRFAPGQPNHGKGTKAAPGWFHGFHADIWQAFALAVYAADQHQSASARVVPVLSRAHCARVAADLLDPTEDVTV